MLPRLRVKQHAPAVGRGLEDLVSGRAVEQHGVRAVLALDDVAAVTRIPLEHVVAGTHEGDVVALLAVDEVVAFAAEQQVDAVAAEDRVVAGAAIDRDLDQRGQVAGGRETVVAAVGVQHEVLGCADVDAERRRVEAVEPHARAIGGRGEHFRPTAAVDLDRVDAGPAFVEIGVVAWIPDHPVVSALAEDLVIGVSTGEGVVFGSAK